MVALSLLLALFADTSATVYASAEVASYTEVGQADDGSVTFRTNAPGDAVVLVEFTSSEVLVLTEPGEYTPQSLWAMATQGPALARR